MAHVTVRASCRDSGFRIEHHRRSRAVPSRAATPWIDVPAARSMLLATCPTPPRAAPSLRRASGVLDTATCRWTRATPSLRRRVAHGTSHLSESLRQSLATLAQGDQQVAKTATPYAQMVSNRKLPNLRGLLATSTSELSSPLIRGSFRLNLIGLSLRRRTTARMTKTAEPVTTFQN